MNLLGLFYKCGEVLNARASAHYFADLNKITSAPTAQTTAISGVDVERIDALLMGLPAGAIALSKVP